MFRKLIFKINKSLLRIISFTLLLVIYFLGKTFSEIYRLLCTKTGKFGERINHSIFINKSINSVVNIYNSLISLLDLPTGSTIARTELIELSIRNMKVKKTRTLITIGGMVIGIGTIVFLVSIGYGFEKLVITRVARLNEMKQADVTVQAGNKVNIDDETLSNIKGIPEVELALPMIAVVGKVNYLSSQTDMAVYGVTTKYLQESAIKPVLGEFFENEDISSNTNESDENVSGVSSETEKGNYGEVIQNVVFSIDPDEWVGVYNKPSPNSKIIGYTKRVEGQQNGQEVWGNAYTLEDNSSTLFEEVSMEKWIKSDVVLWEKKDCYSIKTVDCENNKYLMLRDKNNIQVRKTGYLPELNLQISGVNTFKPEVLSATTESTNQTNDTSISWVEIESETGIDTESEIKIVELSASSKKVAVINRAALAVLGIKEEDAIGKKFKTSFIVVGDLLPDSKENLQSLEAEYTIVGVVPEDETPYFYVPFIDLKTMGITHFSQVKVVVDDEANLDKVRRQIEGMGYVTNSVADTVDQINSLFNTARVVLMLIGMIALGIAALGMFNTLTVSLLERTREVGLMKAMGMKSSEVQELFLTESMLMGFCGGVFGIVFGGILGELVGVALSFFALFKGIGVIDVSYIPFVFIVIIITLSLIIGFATGIFPSKRATKISALDALRYE